MGLTTRNKIGGAILTLAASAFGLDRWVIGQEGQDVAVAEAAVVSAPSRPARTAGNAPGDASDKPAAPGRTLSARLREVAAVERLDLAEIPDAFRPSRAWFPEPESESSAAPEAAPAPAAVEAPRANPAAEFRARHRLTAVMKAGRRGGGLAMIDGRTFVPGQVIDGFTLVAVRERSAVLRNGESVVELVIDGR